MPPPRPAPISCTNPGNGPRTKHSDPIAKTKGIWDDNLDLSAARARTVAKYLTDQGVPPKLLGTQAMGDTLPRQNKSASRRVEIVVSTRD